MRKMEDYGEYEDYYNDYESEDILEAEYAEELTRIGEDTTIKQMYDECLEPTLFSASDQLGLLFISCLLFKICTQLLPTSRTLCHIISLLCGLLGLYSIIGVTATYTAILGVSTYVCVLCCAKNSIGTNTYRYVVGFLLLYLVFREYVDILSETWEQVRGVQMIIVLKTLSLCFELSTKARKETPHILDYLGYIFCPANVVFGPWISFGLYCRVYERRAWVNAKNFITLAKSFGWVVKVFATSTFAFLCLGISSCWVYWLFLGMTSSWAVAVRDALSVRFSHYFIAIISEATSVLSGFYSIDGSMNIEVCIPWKIEFPRSLVEVVVYWNMPMHKWLKLHVFRPLSHLHPFWPLIITFLVSSTLHGLNFGLTMVLLSLGVYTYVEYTLRDKLSSVFDACVRSRACEPSCRHIYNANNWVVYLVNLAFRFWTYFHLSYLGIMMDKSQRKSESMHITEHFLNELKRWQNLNYASHWAVLVTYLGMEVI